MNTQPPEKQVGFGRARELIARSVKPLAPASTALDKLAGLAAAEDGRALVHCPSVDSSRKEGYAVIGAELVSASELSPVRLRLSGMLTAGDKGGAVVSPGIAVRVTTGALLPPGADAVLADEFAEVKGDELICLAPAEPGRNVLPKGADVKPGDVLCRAGEVINPGMAGLLASGGVASLAAHPLPRAAVLATGSEVHHPGEPLPPGGLYASNMASLCAWLESLGMAGPARLAADDLDAIREAAAGLLDSADSLITSGGTGHGERDLIGQALEDIGVRTVFDGVRLGPGKGAVFGMLGPKPVLCLPGGPPACLVAFLKLALPALKLLAGHFETGLPQAWVCLEREAKGQAGWNNVIQGALMWQSQGPPVFRQLRGAGRLAGIARATALLTLDEDVTMIPAGTCAKAELIGPPLSGL